MKKMSPRHKTDKGPERTKKNSKKHSDRKKSTMTNNNLTIAMSRKLDRMFEYLETAGFSADSKALADAIFENFHKNRRRQDDRDAHLYYDSRAIPLPQGVRPSLMSERRLKYSAGDVTLELSVTPVFPGRFEVTGRFDGAARESTIISRLKGRRTVRAETDEFGFFTFSSVDPGTYSLHCKVGDKEIIVHDLELR
jgi:hypothetical protein